MKIPVLIFAFLCISNTVQAQSQQTTVPFREKDSYKFTLDYNFKSKPPPPNDHISWTDNSRKADLLPYVKITLQMLDVLEYDYRVRVMSNRGTAVYKKRVKGRLMEINLDLGFTEDLIERLVPHRYAVQFLDKEKNIHSQVIIEVTEKGTLLLNDELFGQL